MNGKERRYPFCPARYAHDGQEYKLVSRNAGKLYADYVKCK